MSFYNRKYWRLILLLMMVFTTCSVGGCQEYFQELVYGEGSPGVTPEEYKREQDQANAPFFSLGTEPNLLLTTPREASATSATFTSPPSGDAVVLIAGGIIYDPPAEILTLGASPSFAATTGPMMTARGGHTANLITSGQFEGQVLIAGGDSISGSTGFAIASAERYDPT